MSKIVAAVKALWAPKTISVEPIYPINQERMAALTRQINEIVATNPVR